MQPDQKIDDRLLALRGALAPGTRVRVNVMLRRDPSSDDYQSTRHHLSQLGVQAGANRPFAGILVTDMPLGLLEQVAGLSGVEWLGAPADDAPLEELLDSP